MRVPENTLAATADIATAARRLQAQGYSLDWQAQATGSPIPQLVTDDVGPWSHRDHLARLATLTRQLGEAMATPGPGLTPQQIQDATRDAAAAGYYPPAAYDEEGNLIAGAVVGHPWDRTDELCATRLEILEFLIKRPHLSHAEVSRHVGRSRRTVDRISELISTVRHDPEWVAHAIDALTAYRADEENPTALALEIGIVDVERNAVSRTHPAVANLADAA